MNICHEHKFILWAPPRTAARFVHSALSKLGDMSPLTHRIGIPTDGQDYSVVCTVRNPYTRVLSAWKWMNNIGIKNLYSPDNFTEFVCKHVPVPGTRPISKELGPRRNMVTHLIHTESVEDDLRALPWVPDNTPFPKNLYRSDYRGYSPRALYNEEIQEKIKQIYMGDFVEFGYDPNMVPTKF